MANITLLKIWNMDVEEAEKSLDTITSKGYTVKTSSDNIYVKIISCFSSIKCPFLSDFENELLNNESFIKTLEINVKEQSHSDALLKTIYMTGMDNYLLRIEELQKDVLLKEEKRAIEIKNKEEKAGILLENTYNVEMSDVCPFNPHDNSSFYYIDPNDGEKKLLEAHHIFQSKGNCYDIDSVFRYILAGGQVNLDDNYIKRIFNKEGKVDYSKEGLTTQTLRNKTYHDGIKIINLNENSITSLLDVQFPNTTQMLTIDSNPLGNNYFFNDSGSNIAILSMKNCLIENLDFKHLPTGLVNLNVSNNPKLTTLNNIGYLKKLQLFDIRKTGIKNLNINKFYSVKSPDKGSKLRIYCDTDIVIKMKDDKMPEWIEIIRS